MTHFLIKLVGISSYQSRKAGDFLYLEAHDALCYEGREIPIAEHNDLVPKVMERYRDYLPRLPQVVLLARETTAPEKAPAPPSSEPAPPAEPVVFMGFADGKASDAEDADAPGEDPEAEAPPSPKPNKGGRPQKYGKGGVVKP
jgi:hypothetical protein